MYKNLIITIVAVLSLSGCTQVVTAPIKVVGATAGAVIDVTGSTVRAVVGSDKDDD